MRSTCLRTALAFARPGLADVLICHWHGLDFSGKSVSLRGEFSVVTTHGTVETQHINNPRPVDALFFFGPESGELTAKDASTLDRLCAAGIDARGVPIYMVVDRMMLEASCRGVITNALGTSRSWGPKHKQELKLRSYEGATGRIIVRPRTHIARPHELHAVLSIFVEHSETCLIKPALGEGGEGLRIFCPGDAFPLFDETVVVQRLIPDPLLIEGHKADLRWYLLIHSDNRTLSGRVGPIFIRRAAIPYLGNQETEAAEITNTSFLRRRGFIPDMHLLAPMSDISQSLLDVILDQLNSLANDLVSAYFSDATRSCTAGTEVPNRRIVFGIDSLVADPNREPRVYFLETNPFPAFFRGVPDCDAAMEKMLTEEYLPVLMG